MKKLTRQIYVGELPIGGGAPVSIQSMLSEPAEDIAANVAQARSLDAAGCQIVRISVPTPKSAESLAAVKAATAMPVVADIHFDYKMALLALEAGADKIRINPGNIGGPDKVAAVVEACKKHGAPIRIGVNSGSLEKELLQKYGESTAEAMVESTARHVDMLEALDFHDIVIAMKSPYLDTVVQANRLAAERFNYPLHIGVTESGTRTFGLVKSAVGLGSLLLDGIGDTMRVSLSTDPVEEIHAAKMILKAVGLPGYGPTVIACPTCGRTKVDVMGMAERLEAQIAGMNRDITVAVMGCVVNGPGEASQADYGIAGGDGRGIIFKRGEIVATCDEQDLINRLLDTIEQDAQTTLYI